MSVPTERKSRGSKHERRQLGDRRCRNCPHVEEDSWEEPEDGTDVRVWYCEHPLSEKGCFGLLMTGAYGSSHEEWHFEGSAPDWCPLTERCPECRLNTIARPDGKATVAGKICPTCGGVGSVTPEQFFTWGLENNGRDLDAIGT